MPSRKSPAASTASSRILGVALWSATLSCLASLGLTACGSAEPRLQPSFPAQASPQRAKGKVLFVVSAARTQTLADGSKRPTGTFLGEFYEPYIQFTRHGYSVGFATLEGKPPAVDPESLDDDYWETAEERGEAKAFIESSSAWRQPLDLDRIDASGFDGIVVPGGQGVMVDLLDAPELHALLHEFARQHKPVGLICHAPAILTRLKPPHALAERTVTSVSGFEEFYIESFVMGADAQVRNIGERLETAGYQHVAAFPGRENAVRDCNLVTSQNPFSTRRFSELYLSALHDYGRGATCVRRVH